MSSVVSTGASPPTRMPSASWARTSPVRADCTCDSEVASSWAARTRSSRLPVPADSLALASSRCSRALSAARWLASTRRCWESAAT